MEFLRGAVLLKRQRCLKRKVTSFCVHKPQDIMHGFQVNRTTAISPSVLQKFQLVSGLLVMETSWQNFKDLITAYTEKGQQCLFILHY